MNEVRHSSIQQPVQNSAMGHCEMSEMTKHDAVANGKLDQSHCQKSLCCLGVALDEHPHVFDYSIQLMDGSYSNYTDQLTVGIYHLPYRPPNHVLFL